MMSVVTAQMVKELREMTLAGMTDCKKALTEAEGDMDKAVVILREKGLASAAKKAGRAASEGVVSTVIVDDKFGFVFEVNCETDFVTKNDGFCKLVSDIQTIISLKRPENLDALLALTLPSGKNVSDEVTQLVATIGENIQVRRFEKVGSDSSFVASYVHAGGRIGVLVELSGTNLLQSNKDVLTEIAKDVALQAAAMKPQYLNESEIPAAIIRTEEEIVRNKFLAQGKPEAALAKIVPSSIKTWIKEICLIDQPFVKDDSKNTAQYVLDAGKALKIPDLSISRFVRMELGQGVEKKSEDFAAEVAATMAAAKA